MEFKTISIKSFISDLPRVFNENFRALKEFINSIYDFTQNKLKAAAAEINGQITANTVKTKNIEVSGSVTIIKNGGLTIQYKDPETQTYTTINVPADIVALQKRVEALENGKSVPENTIPTYDNVDAIGRDDDMPIEVIKQ